MSKVRIGHGYDVHRYIPGDGFVLGGVNIACDKAVQAHSDGDVLIHALCDAMLGAMGRGDIGQRFPDDDAANHNRDSREFLTDVCAQMRADGLRLGNVDVTVIAQAPRLAQYIDSMCAALAATLGCDRAQVNVKATTTERLGFIGREEGIAAAAVVVLEAEE